MVVTGPPAGSSWVSKESRLHMTRFRLQELQSRDSFCFALFCSWNLWRDYSNGHRQEILGTCTEWRVHRDPSEKSSGRDLVSAVTGSGHTCIRRAASLKLLITLKLITPLSKQPQHLKAFFYQFFSGGEKPCETLPERRQNIIATSPLCPPAKAPPDRSVNPLSWLVEQFSFPRGRGRSPSQASIQGFSVTKATLMQIHFSLGENKTPKWHQLKNVLWEQVIPI